MDRQKPLEYLRARSHKTGPAGPPAPQLPVPPESVVAWLEAAYPPRDWGPGHQRDDLMFYSGIRAVVTLLRNRIQEASSSVPVVRP